MTEKEYDGEDIIDATTAVRLAAGDVVAGDDVSLSAEDSTLAGVNAGNGVAVTLNCALEGDDAGNYTLSSTLPSITADVLQADGSALVPTPPAETAAIAGDQVSIDLSSVLPDLDGNKDYGTKTFAVVSGGDEIFEPGYTTTGETLAGTLKSSATGSNDVVLSVTTTNYKDLQNFTLSVKVVAQMTDIVFNDGSAAYTGDTLIYEEASSAAYPVAVAVYTYAAKSGGATLEDDKPLTAGVYDVTATLTTADAKGTKTAEFTVTAADLAAVTPTVTGDAQVGETLTASLPGLNLRTGDVTWAWKADGISVGASAGTYVPDATDVGKYITVEATAASGNLTGASLSSAGVTVAAKPISGTVTVTTSPAGPILENTTLTADVTGIEPAAAQGGLSLQWNKNGTPITGETNPTYLLPSGVNAGDEFTVTATASGGYSGSLTSAPAVVDTIALTGSITVSGNKAYGDTLTADTSGVGPIGAEFDLQWMRDGVAIPNADQATYTIDTADLGKNITVKAVGKNNYSGEIVSAAIKADDLKTYPVTVQPKPYDKSSGQGITFTIDADFSKFVGLTVNGKVLIRDKDYTAKAGSIVITLLPSYLDTLAAGTYDVRVALTDGEVVLSITIPQAATDPAAPGTTQPGTTGTTTKTPARDGTTPRTGDEAPIALLVLLVCVMGGGAAFAIVMKRRVRSR